MTSREPDLPKGDILIVDDNLSNLRLLSAMLTGRGYKARCVPSGAMALTVAQGAPPDLILLDITMPGLDGYEVCRRLKAETATRDIPVIFISVLDEPLDKVRAFTLGGADYLTKPFQLEEVLIRIDHQLALRRLQQKLHQANEELEQRVAARTAELAATVSALQEQIAERRRAEEQRAGLERQLHQSQKMEALGLMAGGIAHDFNNLLTIILGRSESLQSRYPDPGVRREAEKIKIAAERGCALTRQLLAFSRRQPIEPRIVDLNQVIRELRAMLRSLLGGRIELITRLAPELDRVRVDPGQWEQVIMNLAVNARDAMPEGGALTIATANLAAADGHGPGVLLSVNDTGVGIDEAIQSRIFEPFFTTKRDRGTGLGLATVHGIVSRSGGNIQVWSAPGRGTTFKIRLPRVAEG